MSPSVSAPPTPLSEAQSLLDELLCLDYLGSASLSIELNAVNLTMEVEAPALADEGQRLWNQYAVLSAKLRRDGYRLTVPIFNTATYRFIAKVVRMNRD